MTFGYKKYVRGAGMEAAKKAAAQNTAAPPAVPVSTGDVEAMSYEEDIIERAAKAETELERLQLEASELSLAADEARQAFEQDPTPESLADRDILAQKSKNAVAAAQAFTAGIADIRSAAGRQKSRIRLQEITPQLFWEQRLSGPASRIATLFKDFQRDLEKELEIVRKGLTEHNNLLSEAGQLERALGNKDVGGTYGSVDLKRAVEFIRGKLEVEIGKSSRAPFEDTGSASLSFQNPTGHDGLFTAEATFRVKDLEKRLISGGGTL